MSSIVTFEYLNNGDWFTVAGVRDATELTGNVSKDVHRVIRDCQTAKEFSMPGKGVNFFFIKEIKILDKVNITECSLYFSICKPQECEG